MHRYAPYPGRNPSRNDVSSPEHVNWSSYQETRRADNQSSSPSRYASNLEDMTENPDHMDLVQTLLSHLKDSEEIPEAAQELIKKFMNKTNDEISDDDDSYLYGAENETENQSEDDGNVEEMIAEFQRHVQAQGGRIDPELKLKISEFLSQKYAEGSIRSEVIEKFVHILEDVNETVEEIPQSPSPIPSPPLPQKSPPMWESTHQSPPEETHHFPSKEDQKLPSNHLEITKKIEILETELNRLEAQRAVILQKKSKQSRKMDPFIVATNKVVEDMRQQIVQCNIELEKIRCEKKRKSSTISKVESPKTDETKKRATAADFWSQEKKSPQREDLIKLLTEEDESPNLLKNLRDTLKNLGTSNIVDTLLKNVLEKNAEEKIEKVITPEEIDYIDGGDHWCKHCDLKFSQLQVFLLHLSRKHPPEQLFSKKPVPWRQVNCDKKSKKVQRPLKGVEFIFPSSAFYCTCCKEFSGDSEAAISHLTSTEHHIKYNEFTERHPNYEEALASRKKLATQAVEEEPKIQSVVKETIKFPLQPTINVKPLPDAIPAQAVGQTKNKLKDDEKSTKRSKHDVDKSEKKRYERDEHWDDRKRDLRDEYEKKYGKHSESRSYKPTHGVRPHQLSFDTTDTEENGDIQKSPVLDTFALAKKMILPVITDKSRLNKPALDRQSKVSRILDDDSPPLTHPSVRKEWKKKQTPPRYSPPKPRISKKKHGEKIKKRSPPPQLAKKEVDVEKSARELKMQQLMMKFHQKRNETVKKTVEEPKVTVAESFFAKQAENRAVAPVQKPVAPKPVVTSAKAPIKPPAPQTASWTPSSTYWPQDSANQHAAYWAGAYPQPWAGYYPQNYETSWPSGYTEAPTQSWPSAYAEPPTPTPIATKPPVAKIPTVAKVQTVAKVPAPPVKDLDEDCGTHGASLDDLSDAPPGVDPS